MKTLIYSCDLCGVTAESTAVFPADWSLLEISQNVSVTPFRETASTCATAEICAGCTARLLKTISAQLARKRPE